MKTTALLAATLLALAGCSTHTNDGDVTFYWNFRDAGGGLHGDFGQHGTGCSDVAVDEVDVTFAGHVYQVQDASGNPSCEAGSQRVPGISLSSFHAGTYDFTITGYRGGAAVYEQTGTLSVHGGVENSLDVTLDALSPQSVPLYFTLNGVQSCNGITGVNYAITDARGTLVASSPAAGVPCDPNSFGLLTTDLDLGNYTLAYFQAVSNGVALYEVCNQPLAHLGVAVDLDLLPPVGNGCAGP